jgi:hypothetical protein
LKNKKNKTMPHPAANHYVKQKIKQHKPENNTEGLK